MRRGALPDPSFDPPARAANGFHSDGGDPAKRRTDPSILDPKR